MRQPLLSAGADELSYEIRGIVSKAEQVQAHGLEVFWENIGDPVQKGARLPTWMREIVEDLLREPETFGYCHSKGVRSTREFLAGRTNALGGCQITADDILFFNGLGDAISKLYQFILPTSRVIGPSPAYSTHSSAEAAHANHHPVTYKLDPGNNWYPDLEDLRLKVKYNPNIVGILVINPDNPTGMVYPREILSEIVALADEYGLFLVFDEIYQNITYNGVTAHPLATVIGKVPGISMKGISKEIPWPGSRCGWVEYYNRHEDAEFDRLCQTLDNAKMIEVCSTKLPQMAIPRIFGHAEYPKYRAERNAKIGRRSKLIGDLLRNVPHLMFNETNGAFYNTIIFKEGALRDGQCLAVPHQGLKKVLETEWLEAGMPLDKRFVYYLLAAKQVCVVPVSSFCSDLQGFRVTLLEEDEGRLVEIFSRVRDAVLEFCG